MSARQMGVEMTVEQLIGRLKELDVPDAQVWIDLSILSGSPVQAQLMPASVIETDSAGLELWIRPGSPPEPD